MSNIFSIEQKISDKLNIKRHYTYPIRSTEPLIRDLKNLLKLQNDEQIKLYLNEIINLHNYLVKKVNSNE